MAISVTNVVPQTTPVSAESGQRNPFSSDVGFWGELAMAMGQVTDENQTSALPKEVKSTPQDEQKNDSLAGDDIAQKLPIQAAVTPLSAAKFASETELPPSSSPKKPQDRALSVPLSEVQSQGLKITPHTPQANAAPTPAEAESETGRARSVLASSSAGISTSPEVVNTLIDAPRNEASALATSNATLNPKAAQQEQTQTRKSLRSTPVNIVDSHVQPAGVVNEKKPDATLLTSVKAAGQPTVDQDSITSPVQVPDADNNVPNQAQAQQPAISVARHPKFGQSDTGASPPPLSASANREHKEANTVKLQRGLAATRGLNQPSDISQGGSGDYSLQRPTSGALDQVAVRTLRPAESSGNAQGNATPQLDNTLSSGGQSRTAEVALQASSAQSGARDSAKIGATDNNLSKDPLGASPVGVNIGANKLDATKALSDAAPPIIEAESAASGPTDLNVSTLSAESRVNGSPRDVPQFSEPAHLRLPPHAARLDQGPVQAEILRFSQVGGGEIEVELTPPDQSKFTVTLKLDGRGEATLIVDGGSDSTRARLEQGAQNLREQFAQMGLNLNMNMNAQHRPAPQDGPTHSHADAAKQIGSLGGGATVDVIPSRPVGSGQQLISIYA